MSGYGPGSQFGPASGYGTPVSQQGGMFPQSYGGPAGPGPGSLGGMGTFQQPVPASASYLGPMANSYLANATPPGPGMYGPGGYMGQGPGSSMGGYGGYAMQGACVTPLRRGGDGRGWERGSRRAEVQLAPHKWAEPCSVPGGHVPMALPATGEGSPCPAGCIFCCWQPLQDDRCLLALWPSALHLL